MKKAILLIALFAALFVGGVTASADTTPLPCHPHIPCGSPPEELSFDSTPPPPLRHAYPAKGNLPGLRRRMLRGCIPQAGGSDVCPLPAPKQADMCTNSPPRTFQATCGGYPLPPWCAYYNQGIGWFGHYWALRAYSGGFEYVQTSFTCGSSTTLSWALANWLGGLNAPNVRFTPPAFWAGVVYD